MPYNKVICKTQMFKTDGSVHYEGMQNERDTIKILNGGSRDHCYHLADWNGHYLYR